MKHKSHEVTLMAVTLSLTESIIDTAHSTLFLYKILVPPYGGTGFFFYLSTHVTQHQQLTYQNYKNQDALNLNFLVRLEEANVLEDRLYHECHMVLRCTQQSF